MLLTCGGMGVGGVVDDQCGHVETNGYESNDRNGKKGFGLTLVRKSVA